MDQAQAQSLFQEAMVHQEAGRPGEARPRYERILESFPAFPHAPHLLGVIMGQQGDWHLSRRLIESSLTVHAEDADALSNLAWALFNTGENESALTRAGEALALNPRHARAWFTRGLASHKLGRPVEAVSAYDSALAIRADLAEVWNHRGRSLHLLERHDEAVRSYDQALAYLPDFADAHNNRGSALTLLGRHDEAMESFRRALSLHPAFPQALFNLGLALQTTGRLDEALAHYDAALQLHPTYPEALLYRAHALQRLHKMPQIALASLDRALAARPDYFEAIVTRANLLGHLSQYAAALADYDAALVLRPEVHEAHHNRGQVLSELGREDEAAISYREALRLGGDLHNGQFVLAALGDGKAPPKAPEDFVVGLFDRYASRFDDHLIGTLHYQAHERVCRTLLRLAPEGRADIADLGCGTGLCGPLLKPIAVHLTGVDLSPRMLDAARRRGIYDVLTESDVTGFLAHCAPASFDMLVSADVFIYIGDLQDVFAGAKKALRAGGLFGFSIETTESEDFVLQRTRRYAQSAAYVQRLAALHGFEVIEMEPCVLRKERGCDTHGQVIALRSCAR